MASKDENAEKLSKLIEILKELRANVTPESGLFLNNLAKKFGEFQTEAEDVLNEIKAGTGSASKAAESTQMAGTTSVYVSLFTTEPDNLKQWLRTVRRISEYSLARPIYRTSEHVEEMIRSRPDPRKEAYAIVTVKESDIIRGYVGKSETDARGRELLTVKEGAVKPENVVKFVHGTTVYLFNGDSLTPAGANNR